MTEFLSKQFLAHKCNWGKNHFGSYLMPWWWWASPFAVDVTLLGCWGGPETHAPLQQETTVTAINMVFHVKWPTRSVEGEWNMNSVRFKSPCSNLCSSHSGFFMSHTYLVALFTKSQSSRNKVKSCEIQLSQMERFGSQHALSSVYSNVYEFLDR